MFTQQSSPRPAVHLLGIAGMIGLLALTPASGCRKPASTKPSADPAPPPAYPAAAPRHGRPFTQPGNPNPQANIAQRPARAPKTTSAPDDDPRIPQMKISKQRLQRIAFAMHDYRMANGTFPPQATLLPSGTPGLSWRVLLLPYLGQGDLYRRFNLREPWDGPTNRPLLAEMPEVYHPVVGTPGEETYYQVFVGPGASFEFPEALQKRGLPGLRLADFPDGFSTTLLLIEGGNTVPWTKPQDLVYSPTGPLPKIGGQFRDRAWATTLDGAYFAIRTDAPESLLRLAITRNDGQVFDFAELFPR
jgi:hypothetical protein